MKEAKKERELFVCQLVAEQINREQGTDYHAYLCPDDPPDVRLVSGTGKHRTREAEVISTPQDFTVRPNDNTRKFERQLRLALSASHVSGCHVVVDWHQDAIRFGTDRKIIVALAGIIAANVPPESFFTLRGVEIYRYSSGVARAVNYFHLLRVPSLEAGSS